MANQPPRPTQLEGTIAPSSTTGDNTGTNTARPKPPAIPGTPPPIGNPNIPSEESIGSVIDVEKGRPIRMAMAQKQIEQHRLAKQAKH